MTLWEGIGGGFGILVLFVTITAFLSERAGARLERWARDSGYELLSWDYRWIRRGPYFLSGGGQEVLYVAVRDPEQRMRKGYVRLTTPTDSVEVRWDD
jgi:hypothetical protein